MLPLGDTCYETALDGLDRPACPALLAAQMHEARGRVLVQQRVHRLAARAQHIPAGKQRIAKQQQPQERGAVSTTW